MSLYQDYITKVAYFPSKDSLKDKYSRWRGVAKTLGLSSQALLRLEWIIFYQTAGKKNVTLTASHFGISRKTLHKYLGRFDEKNLNTLEEHSRRPVNTRDWEVTSEEEERVKKIRKEHLKYGKCKIQYLYTQEYKEYISTWKIERVVRKHKLYPEKPKPKQRGHSAPKIRIHQIKEQITNVSSFGFLWHIDAVILRWYNLRRVIFTAIEDKTKIAYARVYTTNKSGYATDFLERLMYLSKGQVELMHSDNGSEFRGEFEKACTNLDIIQVYSRPRTPKDNPALERFNRTLQEEWLEYSETGLDDIPQANQDLTHWLIEYNAYRPHTSLAYQPPLVYAQEKYFPLLPMWSADTQH